MYKLDVTDYFGTHQKVADFIQEMTGLEFTRTAVTMWDEVIPMHWALFFDGEGPLKFRKEIYQDMEPWMWHREKKYSYAA